MAILAERLKSNTTTIVELTKTTKIVIEKQQRQTEDRSELQLLCREAVANNSEGWKPAFRITEKSSLNVLDSADSRIRRGFGTETFLILYELLASLPCPELNLINIRIRSTKMRS